MKSFLLRSFYLDFVGKIRCLIKISYKTSKNYLVDNNTKLDQYENIALNKGTTLIINSRMLKHESALTSKPKCKILHFELECIFFRLNVAVFQTIQSSRKTFSVMHWFSKYMLFITLFLSFCWIEHLQILIEAIQPAITCSKLTKETLEQRCEISSKLTMKTPERRHWCRSIVFIFNFEHISHLVLVFLSLTLSRLMSAGQSELHLGPHQTSIVKPFIVLHSDYS